MTIQEKKQVLTDFYRRMILDHVDPEFSMKFSISADFGEEEIESLSSYKAFIQFKRDVDITDAKRKILNIIALLKMKNFGGYEGFSKYLDESRSSFKTMIQDNEKKKAYFEVLEKMKEKAKTLELF